MIIVDTNVLIYLVLKGKFSEACGKLFLKDSDWAAPRLWRDEITNVFALYERKSLLSRESAILAFKDAESLLNGNEFELPFERILTVALNTGCSGYDAQFIALAEDLGTQLFTFDQKILKNAKHIARNPPDF